MFRKLTILAAIMLGTAAFMRANYPSVRAVVMTGPNSVMHSKALPNDGKTYKPYLQWSGTAADSAVFSDTLLIKKGYAISGLWGGRRATSTMPGHLDVELTSINGVAVGGYSWKDSGVRGQDSWVAAGSVIQFITCTPGSRCPSLRIPNP